MNLVSAGGANRRPTPAAGSHHRTVAAISRSARNQHTARPVLISAATGTLGRAFARLCDLRGIPHRVVSRREMDIADPDSVERMLDAANPWAFINAAGYVRVDTAEREQDQCFRENTTGVEITARACARRHISFATFSSDLVFDGARSHPYLESDPVAPLNVYGSSKAEAERRAMNVHPEALVIRTSAFFGPWDEYNFVTQVLRNLAAGDPFAAADDAVMSPTYIPDLVHTTLNLLLDGEHGLWHLANVASLTWYEFAQRAAERAGLDTRRLEARPSSQLGLAARRPRFSALGSERGVLLPPLDDALGCYFNDCEVQWRKEEPGASTEVASLLALSDAA